MEIFRQNKKPQIDEIKKLEVLAARKIENEPALPGCEMLAGQMARETRASIRAKAVFYAAFWVVAVPLAISAILALAQFAIFKSDIVTCSIWLYCAGGFLLLYGLFNGAAKRLYIGYILGFRGAGNALRKGWNGVEYGGVYQMDDYLYKRDILKLWD